MAEAQKKEDKKAEDNFKYFRSTEQSGLTVIKKDGTKVRFTQYHDTFKGDFIRVGYFKTDDKEVIERLEANPAVQQVSRQDFEEGTSA